MININKMLRSKHYEKISEIVEETKKLLTSQGNVFDTIIPPIIFLILNAIFGIDVAIWGSLIFVIFVGVYRLVKGHTLKFAFGGLGGVIFSLFLVNYLGQSRAFFLPPIVIAGFTGTACLVSFFLGQPVAAWTSHLARKWPRDWYWHPQVKPAYSEVTLVWGVIIISRLILMINLYQGSSTETLGFFQVVTGWPGTALILMLSYIYGMWRLKKLEGPSVTEFVGQMEPPWEGQKRGF
jgi:hypothetical protein